MQVATTLAFRRAVRNAAKALGLPISPRSWTEGAKSGTRVRHVGFEMSYHNEVIEQIVRLAEQALNKNGTTATARVSKAGYLRGTCVLA